MNSHPKAIKLYLILAAFFVANAILSEFIGVKIFSVENTLGLKPFSISLFGVNHLSFNMSAGIITWPIIFVMTDIINEYFGLKQVRFISILTAALIAYTFFFTGLAIKLPATDFWLFQEVEGQKINMNLAFDKIFGQGMWIIVGSITAFIFSQLVDVMIFHRIKKMTGERKLWLRSTGSTVVSQIVDSFVVTFIAFYLNPAYHWSWQMVFAICLVGYIYKFLVAVLMTPILYIVHVLIDHYLGKELAKELTDQAAKQ